jgi:hypothetical protein
MIIILHAIWDAFNAVTPWSTKMNHGNAELTSQCWIPLLLAVQFDERYLGPRALAEHSSSHGTRRVEKLNYVPSVLDRMQSGSYTLLWLLVSIRASHAQKSLKKQSMQYTFFQVLLFRLLKAQCYKLEDRGFSSRWSHCIRFNRPNPSSRTMFLRSTRPVIEMGSRNLHGGKGVAGV